MTPHAGDTAPESPDPADRPVSVRVAPSVAWVDVDPALDPGAGETVVLAHLPEGRPMVLRGSAAAIWHCVLAQVSISDVISDVRATLADSPDDLDELVLAFLRELQQAGLVLLSGPSSPA